MRIRFVTAFFVMFFVVISCGVSSTFGESSYNIAPVSPLQTRLPKSFVRPVRIRVSAPVTAAGSAVVLPCAEELHSDAVYLSKLIWAEARGVKGSARKAAVAWCVLNRVDDPRWPSTVKEVILQKDQFADISNAPSDDFFDLALSVLNFYHSEKAGVYDTGRTLPNDYFYFHGDGLQNHFKKDHDDSKFWDWSFPDPYAD